MSHLNFMWCLMMNFTQFHKLGKEKYPQIGHILCKSAHKVVHQIILTPSILGSLKILRKIPAKLQLKCRKLHHKRIEILSHWRITYNKYKKAWSARECQFLKWSNAQFPRELETHQTYQKLFLINNNPTCKVGCHLTRDKIDQKRLRWSISHQLASGDLQGWLIKPDRNMIYLINYH